jgi:hypothetical protein
MVEHGELWQLPHSAACSAASGRTAAERIDQVLAIDVSWNCGNRHSR